MTSIDPTALLAELAAIQRDVRTVAADENLALLDGKSERALDRITAGLAALMSSIAAPPPVDNGMLGPIRARLDDAFAQLDDLRERVQAVEANIINHDQRIRAIARKADGHG